MSSASLDISRTEAIGLRDVLAFVWADRYRIATVGVIAAVLAVLVVLSMTPVYQSDALIKVELERRSINAALGKAAELMEAPPELAAEIEMISSRRIIGDVVDANNMAIAVEPRRFPVIGVIVGRLSSDEPHGGAPLPLGLSRYAWGNPRIQIDRFDVPELMLDREFQIASRGAGRYALLRGDRTVLEGTVGEPASAELESGGAVSINVASLDPGPDAVFTVKRKRRNEVIAEVTSRLYVEERGRDSGVLSVVYRSDDPLDARDTLNDILARYVAENIRQKSEEAQRTLAFLDTEIPKLRQRVDAAELALNKFKLTHASVDLGAETELTLNQSIDLENQRFELRQRMVEMSRQFGPNHPEMQALQEQINRLDSAKASTENRLRKLPDSQQELVRLSRDVEVANASYVAMLNSSQELQIAQAGAIGDARVIDQAILPLLAVAPKGKLIVAFAIACAVLIAMIISIGRRTFSGGIRDPSTLEAGLGLETYGMIPFSQREKSLVDGSRHRGRGVRPLPLAHLDSSDPAIEALRSLRVSLELLVEQSENNIVMVTSPAPGAGKSFVTSNLALVLAMSGKRVLVVDADMRLSSLSQRMNFEGAPGLHEFLTSDAEVGDFVRPTLTPGLSILPAGHGGGNPAELLSRPKMRQSIEALASRYDMVLIDTPPVLPVADASIVGRYASNAFIVVRNGDATLGVVSDAARRLRQADVTVSGTIFNQIDTSASYGRYAASVYGTRPQPVLIEHG